MIDTHRWASVLKTQSSHGQNPRRRTRARAPSSLFGGAKPVDVKYVEDKPREAIPERREAEERPTERRQYEEPKDSDAIDGDASPRSTLARRTIFLFRLAERGETQAQSPKAVHRRPRRRGARAPSSVALVRARRRSKKPVAIGRLKI